MTITRKQWLDLNEAALAKQIEVYLRQGMPLTPEQIQERRDYFENAAFTIETVAQKAEPMGSARRDAPEAQPEG